MSMSKEKPNLHVIQIPERTHFQDFVLSISQVVNQDTLAVGVFVMRKDRTVACGISHDVGLTKTDIKGACSMLEEDIIEMVWNNDFKEKPIV